MNTKEIEALESYYKTENEYWNGFIFEMLCAVIKQGQFENIEQPLKIFDAGTEIFMEHYKKPLKAVQLFTSELEKFKFNQSQKLFIYEWLCKYLKETDFEEIDLSQIKELLESHRDKLKSESQPLKPLTKNIREMLKEMMQKEFEALPETLKGIDPVQRLNILCKLIPFILPKVESVHHELNEPNDYDFKL